MNGHELQRLMDERHKKNPEIFGHGIICPEWKHHFPLDEKDIFDLAGATDDDIRKMEETGLITT